ncbi:MAG: AsnC family transcriptional regulator [Sulfuriflexus sp.]|nr:AsnC family transcriptional regulator [Sulfuriflexus sp.]
MSELNIKYDNDALLLDDVDYRIIHATQKGLPRTPQPYHFIASELELDAGDVMQRIQRMQDIGVIRRIGAVPNHYALGFHGNGMTVWDVPDEYAHDVGAQVGALDFVSHCYLRPRHLPDWPYNLFAMVHGRDRDEVNAKMENISELLGSQCRGHSVLYSSRILKKTGLRITERR